MTSSVPVRYFAAASEASTTEEEILSVPPDATLAWLRAHLVMAYGTAMAAAIGNGSFLIDGVAATDDGARIGEKVEVLLPFSGG